MVHCGKHTAAYENAIEERLKSLSTREQFLAELVEIRQELLNGTFEPLNARAVPKKP